VALYNELAAGSSKFINSASETVNMLDKCTNAFKFISADRAQIHEGRYFESSVSKAISASGVLNISFVTSSTRYIHFRQAVVSCSADKVAIDLYEGNSLSGGAVVSTYNKNRISTAAATLSIYTTASITSDGTLIHQSYIGGGTGVSSTVSGGNVGQENEWVFAQNQNYNLRITNNSTEENTIVVNSVWVELDA